MRMIKVVVMMMAVLAELIAFAGDSIPFSLDTYIEPTVESSIDVSWDASWIGGNSNATVVIADNGADVKSTTGVGKFLYSSLLVGKHELTYTTYVGGVKQDEFYSAVVYTTVPGCSHVTANTSECAATCTEAGYTGDWVCEICGVVVERGATIPALGHETVETKVAKEATCTEAGWTHEVSCSRCNEIFEESLPIAALGHNEDEGVVTKPPTISEDGVMTHCCTRCGVVVRTEVIPKIIIEWTVDANGVLTGVKLNGATEVTIPDNVTSIGDRTFYNCSGLTEVTIPNCVTNIGDWAFAGCKSLKNVVAPSSVLKIGEGAFAGCSSITNMVLPFIGAARQSDLPLYTPQSSFGYIFGTSEYPGCVATAQVWTNSTSVTYYIPSSLASVAITDETETGYCAFRNCKNIQQVILNEGVQRIRGSTFDNCISLRDVYIPKTTTAIVGTSFWGCTSLSSVTIPGSVNLIDRKAFASDANLTTVVFEGDAPEMGSDVFLDVASSCTAYVSRKSTGWGVAIPGTWNGIRIEYLLIAPLASDAAPESVTNAIEVAGFADEAGVKDAIGGSAEKYSAFKEWAQTVKHPITSYSSASAAGEDAVIANTNAAAAYLLGSERLFENEPKIEFGEIEIGSGEGQAEPQEGNRTITLSVSVMDGDNPEPVKVAVEKVKAMFEATSNLGDWEGDAKLAPTVEILEGDGNSLRFKVTPGDGTSDRAFLRIRK